MPFINASVSKAVQAEIERAEEMDRFIQKTVPDGFAGDTDVKLLVAGIFSLVMEHHGAILYLLRAGQFDGSAFALVRPLIDSAYRAHWIYACAKPDIVARIKNGEDVFPGLINMAAEIEKKIDTDGFFPSIAPYITTLHGYTHGGLEQLGRRFDAAGNVAPNYSDDEKREAINAVTGHFTVLAIAWCQLVSADPPDKESRSKAISDFYVAHYPLLNLNAP
jgi:hypothetical protein